MIEFWTEHVAVLLEHALRYLVPEWIYVSEDGAVRNLLQINIQPGKE